MSNNIDYEQSFHKTDELLTKSYKELCKYKDAFRTYRDSITLIIGSIEDSQLRTYLIGIVDVCDAMTEKSS